MSTRHLQRLIHVGCRELGLDADMRHDLQLVATGKASMSDMTEAELEQVVAALKARGFKPGFKGDEKDRRAPSSRADLRYAHVLWALLAEKGAVRRSGHDGLNAFVRARFEKTWGSVPVDINSLRDWRQIADVVEALKAWCLREGIPVTKRQDRDA